MVLAYNFENVTREFCNNSLNLVFGTVCVVYILDLTPFRNNTD